MSPISHPATIVSLTDPGSAIVRVSMTAADCSGCRIAAFCSRTDDMTIPARYAPALAPRPGDRVNVQAPAALSRRAVVIVLLIPMAALVAAIAIATAARLPETAAIVIGFAALAATFGALYLLRRRIERPGAWTITDIAA